MPARLRFQIPRKAFPVANVPFECHFNVSLSLNLYARESIDFSDSIEDHPQLCCAKPPLNDCLETGIMTDLRELSSAYGEQKTDRHLRRLSPLFLN